MIKLKQLKTGQKFNKLTIIELDHIQEYINPKGYKTDKEFYKCSCSCGNTKIILKSSLMNNTTKSCGCLIKETNSKHSLTNSKIYKIRTNMKERCYNRNHPRYKDWGGRGITVCDEWRNNFMAFYNWGMTNGYKDGLTIDRINNNGNYEPGNCRWITNREQTMNRRSSYLITYKNETHNLVEWAKKKNLKIATLWARLKLYNWSIERALEQKPQRLQ